MVHGRVYTRMATEKPNPSARHDVAFARELPRILAAIWRVCNEYEVICCVAKQKPAVRKELRTLLYVS